MKIYIASPYTNGDKEQNVQLQEDAVYHLLKLGHNPYMPLYHHYVQKRYSDLPKTTDFWLNHIDLPWLALCDIAIRFHLFDEDGIEVYSEGADMEEEYCKEHHIPMYHFNDLNSMIEYFKTNKYEN